MTSAVPGFSGFGHSIGNTAAAADNSEPSNVVPGFSGFGHVNGETTRATTRATATNSATVAPETSTTVPGFSGFSHVLQDAPPVHGFSGFGHVNGETSTSTHVPGFSGFGHFDRNDDVKDDDDDDEYDLNLSMDDGALMDPDLYEATMFLKNARDKVMHLRDELDMKAQQQKELVRELRDELGSQKEGYESRLEVLADQFQEFKFATQKDKKELEEQIKIREEAILAAAALKEQALRTEIQTLQAELEAAHAEVHVAQDLTMQITEQYEELRANFTELRKMYMEDQMEWEDQLESEQNARQRDRTLAERVLRQANEDAAVKIRKVRAEGRNMVEAVRTDLTLRLSQKEVALQTTAEELRRLVNAKEGLEIRVEELEADREDLNALTKQTAKVVKERTLEKARNIFFRTLFGE